MATDQHPHGGRRPHFHRGRRGPDRRGDRRPQSQAAPDPARTDGVDVDQIVREIKARIAQRHGIDLSASQIQELAARRLEAILDPRGIKPSLLEQLRKSAGAPANIAPGEPPAGYEFEDHTIFDTHNGLLRGLRRMLNPLLKLFFNPNPIAHALNTQAKLNKDAAKREQERERTQAEWNALHYTLVERLVTELSRSTIEAQSLAMKVEALSARVDFYERRVRTLENTAQPVQPVAPVQPAQVTGYPQSPPPVRPHGGTGGAADATADGSRRKRRRRRGRRGPGAPDGPMVPMASGAAADAADDAAGDEIDAAEGVPLEGEFQDGGGADGLERGWTATPEPPAAETAPHAFSQPEASASAGFSAPEAPATAAPSPDAEPDGGAARPERQQTATGTPEGS
jgi:hypothetical protein